MPFLNVERDGAILLVTLNRPEERNAIGSRADCEELVAVAEKANNDASLRALILTGSGSAFCAGGNIKRMLDKSSFTRGATALDTQDNYRRGIQTMATALWNLEIPTIAAVNGHAIGLGCDLACMCDLRIASESAQFAESFVKVGLVPGDGGAWFLPRVVGFAKAAEMIFTGEMLDAKSALAMGLVSRVVAAESLLAEAKSLAQRIAANPPRTMRLAKRLLRHSQNAQLPEILEMSAAFQALVQESADHAEAINAALNKRPPVFHGK
jgi:enoyl-CoA hydratase/carnithine racemase